MADEAPPSGEILRAEFEYEGVRYAAVYERATEKGKLSPRYHLAIRELRGKTEIAQIVGMFSKHRGAYELERWPGSKVDAERLGWQATNMFKRAKKAGGKYRGGFCCNGALAYLCATCKKVRALNEEYQRIYRMKNGLQSSTEPPRIVKAMHAVRHAKPRTAATAC